MREFLEKFKYKIIVFVMLIASTLGNWFLYHGWIIPNNFGDDAVLINMMIISSITASALVP